MMRQIISYDDITTPQPPASPSRPQTNPSSAQPPAKKRKTTPNQRQGGSRQQQQHWDDPGNQAPPMNYDDAPVPASSTTSRTGMDVAAAGGDEEYYEEEQEEEESRELSHDEIWDDSALIDAWNSAAAEYEAYHGPGKSWKDEPVKKSPLWYNVPPATTSKSKQKAAAPSASAATITNGTSTHGAAADPTAGLGADSAPLNFDTYVPSHDPSLAAAAGPLLTVPTMDGMSGTGTGSEMAMVSQDEAFSRAMTAMYWSGYWTAVYHSRRNESAQQVSAQVTGDDTQQEEGGVEEDEDEEMLPAQR